VTEAQFRAKLYKSSPVPVFEVNIDRWARRHEAGVPILAKMEKGSCMGAFFCLSNRSARRLGKPVYFIVVDRRLSHGEKLAVFFHEKGHAIFECSGRTFRSLAAEEVAAELYSLRSLVRFKQYHAAKASIKKIRGWRACASSWRAAPEYREAAIRLLRSKLYMRLVWKVNRELRKKELSGKSR
jgi:hypothetical protein